MFWTIILAVMILNKTKRRQWIVSTGIWMIWGGKGVEVAQVYVPFHFFIEQLLEEKYRIE